jgi:hypothetical protein
MTLIDLATNAIDERDNLRQLLSMVERTKSDLSGRFGSHVGRC